MCEVRLNFFTKTCLTSNYFSRDPHFVILAWVELAGQLCRPQFEAESSDDDGDLQPPPSKKARGDPADRLRGGHKRHRLELFPARGVRKHAQKPCRVCKKMEKEKTRRTIAFTVTWHCVWFLVSRSITRRRIIENLK